MGEVRTFTDSTTHIKVLEYEITRLRKKFNPQEEGTGHYSTAINVLEERILELKSQAAWPFPIDAKDLDEQ